MKDTRLYYSPPTVYLKERYPCNTSTIYATYYACKTRTMATLAATCDWQAFEVEMAKTVNLNKDKPSSLFLSNLRKGFGLDIKNLYIAMTCDLWNNEPD
jgi:hypothetical protein